MQKFAYNIEALKKETKSMTAQIDPNSIKTLMYVFSKAMRKSIQQLYIDTHGLQKVKDLIDKGEHVVLMPHHKSFADFCILFCSHLMLSLPPMFFFGVQEDIPRIGAFDEWMKNCGFMYMKRSEDQPMSTYYLNSALIKETIENNNLTTIYQNAHRQRTGKIHRQ